MIATGQAYFSLGGVALCPARTGRSTHEALHGHRVYFAAMSFKIKEGIPARVRLSLLRPAAAPIEEPLEASQSLSPNNFNLVSSCPKLVLASLARFAQTA